MRMIAAWLFISATLVLCNLVTAAMMTMLADIMLKLDPPESDNALPWIIIGAVAIWVGITFLIGVIDQALHVNKWAKGKP